MIQLDTLTTAFAKLSAQGCTLTSENWTEADTRSKFIDTLLCDCLGWNEHTEIRRELQIGEDRLDYRLSINRPLVIVEAKKAGIDLKVVKQGVRRIKLSTLLKANPALDEPIKQVAQYCWRFSAPIAVLTNGKTFIFFFGSRNDGIPWEDGDAIVIQDIFAADFNFATLHGYLSRAAVSEGRLHAALLRDAPPPAPESVLSRYADPSVKIGKNAIGLVLEPMLRKVFSDVTKDDSPDVLENCYVYPTERSAQPDAEFEALLLDKPPSYLPGSDVLNISSANSFRRFQHNLKDYLAREPEDWAQTLLVIGGIGVGKTMFLKRYFTIDMAADPTRRDSIAFFVDFRKPELDPTKLPEFVYRRLREQMVELDGKAIPGRQNETYDLLSKAGLTHLFWRQVQNFRKLEGTLEKTSPDEYERRLVAYLAKLRDDDREFVNAACQVLRARYHRNVCVILDNADQCEPPYQKAVYIFSRTLETDLKTLIIVSLREEWYWHFGVKNEGPLSAYHDIVYHVPAPRPKDVLAKRLDYAIKLVEEMGFVSKVTMALKNVQLEAKHLPHYLAKVRDAFLDNVEITDMFEGLANGSVRRGLDVFLAFIRSGHMTAAEYLTALQQKTKYTLTFEHVFKAVSCGEYFYYSGDHSIVPNLFRPVSGLGAVWHSYFFRAYVLEWLASRLQQASPAGKGFVAIAQFRLVLQMLGLSDEDHAAFCNECFESGLIEPDIHMTTAFEFWTRVRLSAKGLYILRKLLPHFIYWEGVMLDTPLSDQQLLKRIELLYREAEMPALTQRAKCVRDFITYMGQQEALEQLQVKAAGLSDDCPAVMGALTASLDAELSAIESGTKITLWGAQVVVPNDDPSRT